MDFIVNSKIIITFVHYYSFARCPRDGNFMCLKRLSSGETSEAITTINITMMRRLTLIAASLLLFCGVASAQESKSNADVEFRPHWSLGVQGGVAHTRGESSFNELMSPAAQLSFTYNFHHAMGVRFGLGGWQGKGAVLTNDWQVYSYKFGQVNADYIFNIASAIGGFKHDRVVNPYLMAGIGAAYGFNNEEATPFKDILEYYWEKQVLAPVVRAGVGVDFRLSECISLGIEGNTNMLSDKFNSKKADNIDWQFNVLAGLKVSFGKNNRPSQSYYDRIAAEEAAAAAAAAAAAKAEADRLAAEKAAREKAEREAAERAAAEKAAKEAAARAAAERAAKAAENSENVFFTIGSSVIRKDEAAKIEKLAEWMKANPDFTVSLVGYADKETGTPKGNMKLSQNRVEKVKAMLVKCGIEPSRVDFKGDTVQPFAENAKNRVVTCTLE